MHNHHIHNVNQFTYEHILRNTAWLLTTWLSDCNWMYKISTVRGLKMGCVKYINVSTSHIHIKQ